MNLQFNVHQPLATVFDYLTDMQKFASIHPVISKIDKTGANTYLVHETLKFGFFTSSFTYPVKVEQDYTSKTVTFEANVMKISQIKMVFNLHEENGATIINEAISFKTLLPIKSMMGKIFKAQHEKLFGHMANS